MLDRCESSSKHLNIVWQEQLAAKPDGTDTERTMTIFADNAHAGLSAVVAEGQNFAGLGPASNNQFLRLKAA